MRRISACWLALLWGLAGPPSAAAPPPVVATVLVESYPPFVIERNGAPGGPYVETFVSLAREHGVAATVEAMPIRRALTTAQQRPGYCVLGLPYAAENAEVLLYIGRVAPMFIWAYAKPGWAGRIDRLSDLKRYRVGAVSVAELHRLLLQAGIAYEPLQISAKGAQMLEADRFDVLLSDIGPELAALRGGASVERRYTVLQAERWLACHPQTDAAMVAALRQAMRDGLFAQSTQRIWARYGLEAYYQQVRREWPAANHKP